MEKIVAKYATNHQTNNLDFRKEKLKNTENYLGDTYTYNRSPFKNEYKFDLEEKYSHKES